MRKLYYFIVILLVFYSPVFSQQPIQMVKIGKENFVDVTVDVLIYFFEQKFEDWENEMKKLGYTLMDKQDSVSIYSKGNMQTQMQAISVNKQGVASIYWYDYEGCKSSMSKLFDSLKPYLVMKGDEFDWYAYKTYIIATKTEYNYFCEQIHIKKDKRADAKVK